MRPELKCVKQSVYDNCAVYSVEGNLLSYTSVKKAKALVRLNNAEIINQNPLQIKLTYQKDFEKVPESIISERENKCVVCGLTHDLTRHHVVPKEYLKHMPTHYKNRNYGIVMIVCYECHKRYEHEASKYKLELAMNYDTFFEKKQEARKIYGLTYCLLKYDTFPYTRTIGLYKEFTEILGDDLFKLSIDNQILYLKKLQEEYNPYNYISPGESVVKNVPDLDRFVFDWKQHFVRTSKPKYLPKFWYHYFEEARPV